MNKLIVILLVLMSLNTYSQEEDLSFESYESDKTVKTNRKYIFKAGLLLLPELGSEIKLSKKFSLDLSVKLNPNLTAFTTSSSQVQFLFFPQPTFHFEPKWNYNIIKRTEKGKNTDKFSSNFLSLYTDIHISISPNTYNSFIVGPTWGLQRNFWKYGFIKLNLGIGYIHFFESINKPLFPVSPIIDFRIGLAF